MNRNQPAASVHRSWFNRLKSCFKSKRLNKQELIDQIRQSKNQVLWDNDVLQIIEGALDIAELHAGDIMIHRSQIVCIAQTESTEVFLPRIIAAGHSRYPVIGESIDEVVGLLLAKDLLPLLLKGNKTLNLNHMLRPAFFIPESKRLTVLLRDFRINRNHMALIADEYGGIAGLITIEDILEEIVGNIEDEHDEQSDACIKKINNTSFMVKAITPIDDFNTFFKTNLNDEEYDTLGGLVMHNLGHMPKQNETVTVGQFYFKVIHRDNRRIKLLHVTILKNEL
ncbi:MAG: CBS domain-containing protein [Endozoicomonadaceae bacterium]|nr:CBS domain-containing protein [Endozoicomonadaceae bacterium]